MGGGVVTPELAGAVSAAGGLGTVGMVGLTPAELRSGLRRARELAGGRPVAANLVVPFMKRAYLDVCLAAKVPVVVLHAGFDRALVARLREGGCLVAQTVGTPDQARRAIADGATGLVVQGIEAGGHLVGVEPALDALARVLRVAGDVPVLVAGGIATGADTRRALDAGADAVVAGTRFLLTEESNAHPLYQQRVLDAEMTLETLLFGLGWPMRHRVVPNAATRRWCRRSRWGPRPVVALESVTAPLARLPIAMVRGMAGMHHPAVPLYGPPAPLAGMPDRLIDTTALYAGETAARITTIVPASEAVAELAGTAAG